MAPERFSSSINLPNQRMTPLPSLDYSHSAANFSLTSFSIRVGTIASLASIIARIDNRPGGRPCTLGTVTAP